VKAYFYKVMIINAISIMILAILMLFTPININTTLFASILVFFNIFYLVTHQFLRHKHKQKSFSRVYMMYTVLKLIVLLTLLAVLVKMFKDSVIFIIIAFMYFYTVFTVNDVLSIMSLMKKSAKV
jgi:hypothetical protein